MIGTLLVLELGTLGLALLAQGSEDSELAQGDSEDHYGAAFDPGCVPCNMSLCEAFLTYSSDPDEATAFSMDELQRDPDWVSNSRYRRGAPAVSDEPVQVDPSLLTTENISDRTVVLDVRPRSEFVSGHIRGAVNIPVDHLIAAIEDGRMDSMLHMPIAVICKKGVRSLCAAQLLEEEGFDHVVSVSGGMDVWNEMGLPTSRGPST